MIELESCPFCGGNNLRFMYDVASIRCMDCGATGPDTRNGETFAGLYWNCCKSRLEWTKARPTRPGFYFYKNKKGNVKIVSYEFSQTWGAYRTAPHDHALCDKEARWAGPIPKPVD